MQSSKNLQNTTLSSVKEKIIVSEAEQRLPQTRGEVAAQEQMREFRQNFVTNGEQRAPKARGEVAAQEQMRMVQHAIHTYTTKQPSVARTRGEVAAQEQIRILQHAIAASK